MHTEQGKYLSPNDADPDVIIVRLLNGKLKGCEYHISAGNTLFVAASDAGPAAGDQPLSFPEDSIFIPVDGAGFNFEIIRDPAAGDNLLLRELADNAVRELPLATQEAVTVGTVVLAVRRAGEAWSEAILNYQPGPVPLPVPPPAPGPRRWKIAVLAGLGAIALVLGLVQVKWDNQQREIEALAGRLGDEPGKYQILPGRDGLMYVLAGSERDAVWARQALVRWKSTRQVRTANLSEESQRIWRWLGQHHPFLMAHQIRLDNPELPVLLLSRQRGRLSEQQQAALNEQLLAQLPYAREIAFTEIDDEAVAGQAEAGIKKLALPYTRVDHPDSVTFVITGALNDGELQRVRFFLEEHERRWSGHYVQFAVEMMDDWLKGKSFKFGQHGYVKMTPGHWYFPKP
ncbi:PrgH/EprH family type III secretion apparatus protein [Sodalis sp. RH21]|uniref:PrgH/EprH family type III secretion apparatus protein n=1 Tax=unclassified Sodalis (in: enterobacteria) TaxID=2636512 RepID=UPI0039B5637A